MAVSIFISNNFINVTAGSLQKNKLNVTKCIKTPIQEDLVINGIIMNEDRLADALKNIWADNGGLAKSAKLVVSSTSVLVKKLRVPAVNDRKLLDIIKDEYSEVENYNNLVYDYRVLNPKVKEGGMEVLACACEREFIESYISLFEKSGITLEAITPALSSIINTTSLYKDLSHGTYVIANLDGNNLANTLFVNGEYYYSSRSRLLEDFGTEDADNEMYRILSSLIQFNKSQKTGFDVTNIFFTGDINEQSTQIGAQLSRALEVKVGTLDAKDVSNIQDRYQFNKLFYTLGNL
ncbi:MAG: pilus assembly protein PilM [Ruminococcus sp.]|nr:pilus assembly protein PilM [Ruminococcus sp.]